MSDGSSPVLSQVNGLREDARRFRAVFERTILAVYVMDLEGNFLDANDRALSMTGYSRSELLGLSVSSLAASDEDLGGMQRCLTKVVRDGFLDKPIEHRLKARDGRVVWLSAECSLLCDERGTPYAVVSVALDITERKRAQRRDSHLLRLLSALRSVNQLIVRERDRLDLIHGACEILVRVPEFLSAWVVLFDTSRRVSGSARAGERDGFDRFVADLAASNPPCIEKVLRECDVLVLDVPDREPLCRGCELLCSITEASQMLVRVTTAGQTQGVLGIALPTDFAVSQTEQDLVREVAGDVAFGLYRIELERAEMTAREELDNKKRFIEAILEDIPLGIVVVDTHTRAGRYLNAEFERIHGWPAEALADADSFFEHTMPDTKYREEIRARVAADSAGRAGSRLHWERLKIVTRGGEERYVNVSLILIPGQETAVIAAYEVTDMVRLEEELRRSAERYTIYMQLSSEGIYRAEFSEPIPVTLPPEVQVDLYYDRADLVEANEAFARMYGYARPEDIVGKRLAEFHGGRNKPENREFLKRFAQSGCRAFGAISREVDNAGNEKFFANSVYGLVENGLLVRVWGTQRDVTDLKRIEKILREKNEELMRLNRSLHDANRRLLEVDKAKSEFVSIASHELRTPVTSVLAFTQILLESVDTLEPRERDSYLRVIEREALRLGDLAGDLLDLSRIESGRCELRMKRVSLETIAKEVVGALRIPPDRQVQLACDELGREPVLCDPDKIRQVILNFVENALRYGTLIRISISGGLEYRQVDVSDNGPGIAPEHLEKIFEKFYRVRNGKSAKKGSGLGLAIAKGIIEAHGGEVWVDSTQGEGSVFHFLLNVPPETGDC